MPGLWVWREVVWEVIWDHIAKDRREPLKVFEQARVMAQSLLENNHSAVWRGRPWTEIRARRRLWWGQSLLCGDGLKVEESRILLLQVGLCHMPSSLLPQCLCTSCFPCLEHFLVLSQNWLRFLLLVLYWEALPDLSRQFPAVILYESNFFLFFTYHSLWSYISCSFSRTGTISALFTNVLLAF